MKHEDVALVMRLDTDLAITEFISAMIYVHSQSRPDIQDRWTMDNLPTQQCNALAKLVLALFKKQKLSLDWMK